MITRCYDHRNRPELPRACHVCNRLDVERDIVTRTVDLLLSMGYLLTVDDGGDEYPIEMSMDRDAVLAALMETDMDQLGVSGADGAMIGWIMFVYGNDGWNVISDYSMSLDRILQPINEYADTLD